MIAHCSKNITPDSITGMIFAMEGMKNTVVLLNGPMGCKFYHSTTSKHLALRPPLYLPVEEGGEKLSVDYNFLNDWFFRQSQVPCTYLDGYDYVYGTREKVAKGLAYIRENVKFDLIVVINSPGASLIGDNLQELIQEILGELPFVMLESPGYSGDFSSGYEAAVLELLRQVGIPLWRQRRAADRHEKKAVKTVNLIGISIWQRYWEGDIEELRHLLELCQIQVNCVLCAGSTMDKLTALPEADLNVILSPEFGKGPADFLKKELQMPYYICPCLPIGFEATEQILSDICEILGTDSTTVLQVSQKARAVAWNKINSVYEMCGLPQGVSFAVEGTCFDVYSYARFFIEYFGMIPDCLSVTDTADASSREKLERLLREYHFESAAEKEILDTTAELVFANANTIAALRTRNQVFCGIEISLPGMGYIDVLPKTQMGVTGSLFLVEQVLNGLMSRV